MPRRKGQGSPILRTTPSPTSSTDGNRRPSPSFAEFQDFLAQTASSGGAGSSSGNGGLGEALLSSLCAGSSAPKEGFEGPHVPAAPGPSSALPPTTRKRRRSHVPSEPEAPPRTRSRMGVPLPPALSLDVPAVSPPARSAPSRRSTSRSQRPSPSGSGGAGASPLSVVEQSELSPEATLRPTPSPGLAGTTVRHSEPANLHLLAAQAHATHAAVHMGTAGRAWLELGTPEAAPHPPPPVQATATASTATFPDMCCVAGSRSQRCQLPGHHAGPHVPASRPAQSSQPPTPNQPQTSSAGSAQGLRRSHTTHLDHLGAWHHHNNPFFHPVPSSHPHHHPHHHHHHQQAHPPPTFADFIQHSFLSGAAGGGAAYSQHHAHVLLHLMASMGDPTPARHAASLWENREALIQVAQRMAAQYHHHPRGLTKSQIADLVSFRFNAEEGGDGEEKRDDGDGHCVVCLYGFQHRQLLRVLPCSHHFHAKCIDKWLKSNRTCPICRGDAGQFVGKSVPSP